MVGLDLDAIKTGLQSGVPKTRLAQDLHKACTGLAQGLHKACTKLAQSLHKACTRLALRTPKTGGPKASRFCSYDLKLSIGFPQTGRSLQTGECQYQRGPQTGGVPRPGGTLDRRLLRPRGFLDGWVPRLGRSQTGGFPDQEVLDQGGQIPRPGDSQDREIPRPGVPRVICQLNHFIRGRVMGQSWSLVLFQI